MVKGLYTAYTGMANEQKRLDIISNNLANAATVGYKNESVSNQAFDQVLAIKIRDGAVGAANENIGTMSLGVKLGEVYSDYTQGSFRSTGGTYDFALSGKGFFAVNFVDKDGTTSTKYTRDGSFKINNQGFLVDSNNNRVQGEGGDIQIPTGATNVKVASDGSILVDGSAVDKLKVVDFSDYDYIKKFGDNMYEAVDGATLVESQAQVEQGYTEQSNVNVVSEMVDMITISRAYEANSKIMKAVDGMLDKSVNSVGRL